MYSAALQSNCTCDRMAVVAAVYGDSEEVSSSAVTHSTRSCHSIAFSSLLQLLQLLNMCDKVKCVKCSWTGHACMAVVVAVSEDSDKAHGVSQSHVGLES